MGGVCASRLTVLAGPSAVGKGTVVSRLRALHPELVVSVSATTRDPRPGEVDGVAYYFVSEARFRNLVRSGRMLEWARYGRHLYGTPADPVRVELAAGHPVLLEIDLRGARQVRAQDPQARLIFLAPPSFEELRRRLAGRGTEPADEQRRRLARAREELDARREFDHVVVNDDADRAAREVARLMGLG